MYTNLIIDFGIGLIPILGDFADAWFKCNTRNNILLERYLRERGAKNPAPPPAPKQSTMRRWFGNDPSASGSHPQKPLPHDATDSPAQRARRGPRRRAGPNAPGPSQRDGRGGVSPSKLCSPIVHSPCT